MQYSEGLKYGFMKSTGHKKTGRRGLEEKCGIKMSRCISSCCMRPVNYKGRNNSQIFQRIYFF